MKYFIERHLKDGHFKDNKIIDRTFQDRKLRRKDTSWTLISSLKSPVCEMSYLMKYAIPMQFHIVKFPIYNFVIFEMSIYKMSFYEMSQHP